MPRSLSEFVTSWPIFATSVDAGYEGAEKVASERGVRIPMQEL